MTNNGPKSFKSMLFPPSRGGTNAVYAPLAPAPPPRVIPLSEAQRRAAQLREMKMFINRRRCPVCDAQLEGGIGYDKAALYCVVGGEQEYRVHYQYGLDIPQWSRITYFTTHWAYQLDSTYVVDDMYKNTIFRVDLNLNQKFREMEKKTLLSFEGERLLLPRNLKEEEIDDKIKLLTLFS